MTIVRIYDFSVSNWSGYWWYFYLLVYIWFLIAVHSLAGEQNYANDWSDSCSYWWQYRILFKSFKGEYILFIAFDSTGFVFTIFWHWCERCTHPFAIRLKEPEFLPGVQASIYYMGKIIESFGIVHPEVYIILKLVPRLHIVSIVGWLAFAAFVHATLFCTFTWVYFLCFFRS